MHRSISLFLAAGAAGAAHAQCYRVGPSDEIPGVSGSTPVFINDADLWDPDGPGPSPAILVAVGNFRRAGAATAQDVATWDGQQWHPLGRLGTAVNPFTVAASPTGELVAGGPSGMISGSSLARWNGSAWEAIPTTGNSIYDARFTAAGDLVVAGSFSRINGVAAANIARRTAGVWEPLGAGVGGLAEIIALPADGSIIVGGEFTTAGGNPAAHIGRWDGSSWSALGPGLNGSVWALLPRPDGSLLAGGRFSASGGTPLVNIASWNGAAWSPVGAGLPAGSGGVYSLADAGDDRILAAGDLGSDNASHAMLWDGSAWTDIGRSFNDSTYSLLPTDSGIFAVGSFTRAGGWPALGIARWSGGAWAPTSTLPYTRSLGALAVRNGSEVLAAGVISTLESFDQPRVLARRGDRWEAITSAISGVNVLLPMPDGSLLAAGSFTRAGDVDANRIARWDGVRWSPLGPGLDDSAWDLIPLPDGSIVAAGAFLHAGGIPAARIARWDGSSWHALGQGLASVGPMTVLPDGRLVVSRTNAYPSLHAWDGSAWTTVDGPAANGFVRDARGDLYSWNYFGVSRLEEQGWVSVGHGLTFGTPFMGAFAPLAGEGVLGIGTMLTASGLPCRGLVRADGGTLANANAASSLPSLPSHLAALDDGTYAAIVSAGEFAWVTPAGDPAERPVFIEEPAPTMLACPSGTVTLTARATAGLPVSYHWHSSSGPVGDGPSVSVTAPAIARQWIEVWCVASTADCGAVTETGTIRLYAVTPDVNRDGFIDFFDYIFFTEAFRLGGMPVADFNADGFIDFFDYLDFVDAFERGC